MLTSDSQSSDISLLNARDYRHASSCLANIIIFIIIFDNFQFCVAIKTLRI